MMIKWYLENFLLLVEIYNSLSVFHADFKYLNCLIVYVQYKKLLRINENLDSGFVLLDSEF